MHGEKRRLLVSYDPQSNTAVFSGDTFNVKEEIKRLGRYRFNQADKTWHISALNVAPDDLANLFPTLEVQVAPYERGTQAIKPAVADQDSSLPNGQSVSQFIGAITAALNNAFPATVCIYGVISKVTVASDRIFFDLAEKDRPDELLSCAIWGGIDKKLQGLRTLGFEFEKDLEIMIEARVGLNRKRGQVSLTVERVIAEYTKMKVQAQRELTNERLKKEGLFDRNRTTELPFLPRRLGIITSAQGTVINDFLAAIGESQFGYQLFLVHAAVQGLEAKHDLINALTVFGSRKDIDAVLLFRGGGSSGDLAVFNDYEVAKAICLCPLPVLSAIGHQEDQSSAQDVSFRSFGVPKDLGHFFATLIIDLRKTFSDSRRLIASLCDARIRYVEEGLRGLTTLHRELVSQFLTRSSEALSRVVSALEPLSNYLVSQRQERFSAITGPVLGYADSLRQLYLQGFERLRALLSSGSRAAIATELAALEFAAQQILREANVRLASDEFRVKGLASVMMQLERQHDEADIRVESLARIIADSSPEVQLRRGFAVIRSAAKNSLHLRAESLKPGEEVSIEFIDGLRKAVVSD